MSYCEHEWQTEDDGTIICRRCWTPQVNGEAVPIVYQAYAEKLDFVGEWRENLTEAFGDLKRRFYEVVAMRSVEYGVYDPNRQIGIRTKPVE